eukprot:Gb_01280 [translate_table: standard]
MGSQIMRKIQRRRPAPLQICRDSHKIGKPALPIRSIGSRQPVIIYTKSPKVIHTEAQHFMALVQRLTGSDSHERGKNPTTEHEAISSRDSPVLISSFENMMKSCSIDASVASSSSSVAVVDFAASCSQYGSTSLPPLSPNFLLPSPRLLSPSIFGQDLPLFTPNSEYFFYSPRHFDRLFEPIFTPLQRPPLNAFCSQLSPSPTSLDLF